MSKMHELNVRMLESVTSLPLAQCRVMCAGPQLLEACKALFDELTHTGTASLGTMYKAKAAIAAANRAEEER